MHDVHQIPQLIDVITFHAFTFHDKNFAPFFSFFFLLVDMFGLSNVIRNPMGYFIWSPKFIPLHSRCRKNVPHNKCQELKASLLEEELCGNEGAPVPKGCLAVYVGEEMRRFIIPTSYLCLPAFQALMERVAEEFGFKQAGGLRIPCNEEDFEEMLRSMEEMELRNKKNKKKN